MTRWDRVMTMNWKIKAVINGKEFTMDEMNLWKQKRIRKVLHNLKRRISWTDDTDRMCEQLTALKLQLSYEEIVNLLRIKLAVGVVGMKLAAFLSGKKRLAAITTVFADGITAETFSRMIDALMLEETPEHKKVNLSACPDHYALIANNGTLEVIESTGNMPVPTQFFITFNDETGLQEPRDFRYPYQSTGIAKLKDGTIIGGVRHQFRDTKKGIEVRTLVEFPWICPKTVIKEHQKHLAVEWSNWISWAVQNQ